MLLSLCSDLQQGLTALASNRHHAGPGWTPRGLGRPVGSKRDLAQLLEGPTLTVHQLVGLKFLIPLGPASVHLPGMLNR